MFTGAMFSDSAKPFILEGLLSLFEMKLVQLKLASKANLKPVALEDDFFGSLLFHCLLGAFEGCRPAK